MRKLSNQVINRPKLAQTVFTDIDLTQPQGRIEALSIIADMCVGGYTVQQLGKKSDMPIDVLQRDMSSAIRAIQAIDKMSENVPNEQIVVNIQSTNHV